MKYDDIKNISLDIFLKYIIDISKQRNIYIYGAGMYGRIFGQFFDDNEIEWIGFIDENKQLQGTIVCGKKVFDLKQLNDIEHTAVVISISALPYKAILPVIIEKLLEYGINQENIIRASENLSLAEEIAISVKKPEIYLSQLDSLKNVLNSKRAFLIGNGPSLCLEDINKLKSEVCFGCNRIIELYKSTSWRLTGYFFADPIFINSTQKEYEDISTICNENTYVFTSILSDVYEKWRGKFKNLFFVRTKRSYDNHFSEDIKEGLSTGGTSLYDLLQIMVFMGIKEIYLLGVDFSFHKEAFKNGEVKVNENIKNHTNEIGQDVEGIYYVDLILDGWKFAKKYADSHGIKIYNATRGGKLEVFERVNFDELF